MKKILQHEPYNARAPNVLPSQNPETAKYGREKLFFLTTTNESTVAKHTPKNILPVLSETKIRKWKPDYPGHLSKNYLLYIGFALV